MVIKECSAAQPVGVKRKYYKAAKKETKRLMPIEQMRLRPRNLGHPTTVIEFGQRDVPWAAHHCGLQWLVLMLATFSNCHSCG